MWPALYWLCWSRVGTGVIYCPSEWSRTCRGQNEPESVVKIKFNIITIQNLLNRKSDLIIMLLILVLGIFISEWLLLDSEIINIVVVIILFIIVIVSHCPPNLPTKQVCPVVSLSKKPYSNWLVLVGSRNGLFERDLHKQKIACFTIELKQISID